VALLVTTLRPTYTYHPEADSDTPYVDIMLCFAPFFDIDSADELGMVPLMTDLRAKVDEFGHQRIGMTTEFYRTFPVTADRRWVSQRLGEIIDVAEKAVADPSDYDLDTQAFERNGYGGNIAPNVVDTLALCAMGFPAAGSDNGRGKQLIFIGNPRSQDDPGQLAGGEPPEPQAFPRGTLDKTIAAAGIQVDAIIPDPLVDAPGVVETLVADSGGQRIYYTEAQRSLTDDSVSPRHIENQKAELAAAVDSILGAPPRSALDEVQQTAAAPFRWDVPDLLLQLALLATVGLAAARLGMRL
jgi:Ca-activated chloride channel homolog